MIGVREEGTVAVSAEKVKEEEVGKMEEQFLATLEQIKLAAMPLLWKVGKKGKR